MGATYPFCFNSPCGTRKKDVVQSLASYVYTLRLVKHGQHPSEMMEPAQNKDQKSGVAQGALGGLHSVHCYGVTLVATQAENVLGLKRSCFPTPSHLAGGPRVPSQQCLL